ncbi:fimbrial protein [Serratia fonticola]|jgi:major pilin subunit PapA|uniref:fimbrial protein n=1 Tax=Serratia fonticola TaxID=47917 RepID=UPI0021BBA986|nr:fimbrial protein [Serratia fonticola]
MSISAETANVKKSTIRADKAEDGMKLNRTYSVLALLLCIFVGTAAASPAHQSAEGMRGKLSFSGAVITSPCHIEMASDEQVIPLGIISNATFNRVGAHSSPIPLKIHVVNCVMEKHSAFDKVKMNEESANNGYLVSITFYGESASSTRQDLLGGKDMKHGVGLAIENEQGERLILGEESQLFRLQDNSDVLQLFVMLESYEQLDRIQLGNFYTQATFRLSYK